MHDLAVNWLCNCRSLHVPESLTQPSSSFFVQLNIKDMLVLLQKHCTTVERGAKWSDVPVRP